MSVILYKWCDTNIVQQTLILERLQCTLSEKVLHYFEQLLPRTNLLHFTRWINWEQHEYQSTIIRQRSEKLIGLIVLFSWTEYLQGIVVLFTNKNCLSDYISKWTFVVAHASVCRRIFRHLVSINFITVAICWLKHVLHTSCFDTLYKTLQTLIWDGIKDIIVHKAQTYCKQINPKVNLRFSFLSFKG